MYAHKTCTLTHTNILRSLNGVQNFLGFLDYFKFTGVSGGNDTVESGNDTCTHVSNLAEGDQLVLVSFCCC